MGTRPSRSCINAVDGLLCRMNTVASVSSSPSGASLAFRAINWVASAATAQSVKQTGKTAPSQALPTSAGTDSAAPQTLPLGLLLAVNQPSGNNFRAGLDYAALRNAIKSNDLTAAQQAYGRLQSDLLFGSPSNSAEAISPSGANEHLNIAV